MFVNIHEKLTFLNILVIIATRIANNQQICNRVPNSRDYKRKKSEGGLRMTENRII